MTASTTTTTRVEDPFTNTPLYGGAITVDLPSNFADASQIRQIPDHQEVYLDADGYSSIVIEILEYVRKDSDEEALQEHFADLVRDTGDATMVLEQGKGVMAMQGVKHTHPLQTLTFIQTPPPPQPPQTTHRRKTPDFTYISLLLLRLQEAGSDIMITINIPHYPGEYNGTRDEQGMTRLMRESALVRERVERSFCVREWGLFDG